MFFYFLSLQYNENKNAFLIDSNAFYWETHLFLPYYNILVFNLVHFCNFLSKYFTLYTTQYYIIYTHSILLNLNNT